MAALERTAYPRFPEVLAELTSRVVYEQFDGGRFQAAIFC